MQRLLGKINWPLLLAYGFVSGGLTCVALFFALEWYMDVELILTFLFSMLGAASYVFHVMDGGRGWRWLGMMWWLGAILMMALYAMIEGWLSPALGMAAFCFAAAGVVLFLHSRHRERREQAHELEWQTLGTLPERADVEQLENLTAAEYETLMARQRRGE